MVGTSAALNFITSVSKQLHLQHRAAGDGMRPAYEPWSGIQSQECVGKCHTGHTGSVGHLLILPQDHLLRYSYADRQICRIPFFTAFNGKTVCIISSHDGCISFQRMSHNINTGCACQVPSAGSSCCLHRRSPCSAATHSQPADILRLSSCICNNCKGGNLRTCTGRGRDRYEVCFLAHLREGIYSLTDIHEIA